MRVLAISHSCVTDVNQELYVSMQRLPGVAIDLIVPDRWKSEYSADDLRPKLLPTVNFPVHQLPLYRPGNNSLHFYKSGIAKVMQLARPDVVFLDEEPWSFAAAQVAGICRRFRMPLVCYTKQNIYKKYPWLFSAIERRTHKTASAIIALSEEVRAVLRRKGFKRECPLLAHACDLSLFHPGNSSQLRQTLGLKGIVIGYMGRLVPEKGLDDLAAAARAIRDAHPEKAISVLLVGAGVEEAPLKSRIDQLGLGNCFVFAGAVPHRSAGDYMRCMDLFVLPSRTTPRWKEQFGRVIIEALACSVPVIGSSSGQIPYVINDTNGGLVFEEGDSGDLATKAAMLILNDDLRIKLGRQGQESVRQLYTYDTIAGELAAILEHALAAQRN